MQVLNYAANEPVKSLTRIGNILITKLPNLRGSNMEKSSFYY